MVFVKTFKGYEDKISQLDAQVNDWVQSNAVKVIDVKASLSHEFQGRAATGDLIYTVLYEAAAPVA